MYNYFISFIFITFFAWYYVNTKSLNQCLYENCETFSILSKCHTDVKNGIHEKILEELKQTEYSEIEKIYFYGKFLSEEIYSCVLSNWKYCRNNCIKNYFVIYKESRDPKNIYDKNFCVFNSIVPIVKEMYGNCSISLDYSSCKNKYINRVINAC